MRPSTSLATSLATTLLTVFMAERAYAQGPGQTQYMGCYSSSQGLVFNTTDKYQSNGACQQRCFPIVKAVMAMTGGTDCWCGDTMPSLSTKVDDKFCDKGCDGYPPDNCGSIHGKTPQYWAVWNSGLQSTITNNETTPSSTSSSGSSPTTSSSASVVTVGGQTVVVTASSSPTAGSAPSGPSTAGIAAGVVVGIIAIGAIAGGVWFYLRNKRRHEVEEEYKRQASVSAFINGGKPGSSASSSHDTRLDPAVFAQRRMSDGSIADNQDYSRRILKVTNA